MKIGIDASRYGYKEATGVEWYSFYIINALLKLILDEGSDEIILYSREKLVLPKEIRELIEKNSNRVTLRQIKAKRFWTLWALSREIKLNPPDCLFVPSHALPRNLPDRSVIMIHDVAFKRFPKAYSFKNYHYLDFSTRAAVKKASKVLVPSKATADDLVHFYKCDAEKIEVIHHGYKKSIYPGETLENVFEQSDLFDHFAIHKNSKYFFYVGRLESKKNILGMLEGFKKFSEYHPDFRFVLAGKRGHGFKKVFNKMKELDLVDKVIMPGYVSELENEALMHYCSGFIFASFYEGFGLPILNAFNFNKPVLCSNTSSLPEVAGDAAHFVDTHKVEEIASGMKKIVEDQDYVEDLVNKGSKRLESFDWTEAAQKTLKSFYG